jgi:hypothetical protein
VGRISGSFADDEILLPSSFGGWPPRKVELGHAFSSIKPFWRSGLNTFLAFLLKDNGDVLRGTPG